MVVEVDVVLDSGAQFVHGDEDVTVEVLVLEVRPERFGAGMVVATSRRTHRASDLERGAQCLDLVVAGLAAAFGVKDCASNVRKARRDRLVE